MTPDDSLKLFIGIISAVGALIGTWAGLVFTRVNEHKKWLRDQKLDVCRETYKASQVWINSMLSIKTTMDALVDELAQLNSVTPAGMTKAQQDAHLKKFDDLLQRRTEVEVEAKDLQQQISDFGKLPVTLVASKYVQTGVTDVAGALSLVGRAISAEEREKASRGCRDAQSEMVERFRDDLGIRHPLPVMPFVNYLRRTRRRIKREKTSTLQEA